MITLSEPTIVINEPCNSFTVIDTTDYSTGSGNYSFDLFKQGLRLIRIVYPDGTIKVFGSFQFEPQPDFDVNSTVTILDTDITDANNGSAEWTFNVSQTGAYRVDIMSIPYTNSPATGYNANDLVLGIGGPDFIAIWLGDEEETVIAPVGIGYDFYSYYNNLGEQSVYCTNFISTEEFTLDCNYVDSLNCIYGKYEESFCTNCQCENICKNKKSNNILKATLMLRHLELVQDDYYEYHRLLDLYTPILNTLCHCS